MINIKQIVAREITTPPATEPVTLAEVKAWAIIDFIDDDALLTSMMKGAREDIEYYINLKLVPHTVELFAYSTNGEDELRLPFTLYGTVAAPVVSTIEEGVATVSVAGTTYYTFNNVVYITSISTYKIAYTTNNTVPESLKEAIKMLVTFRYANRGDQSIPADIRGKLDRHVQIAL